MMSSTANSRNRRVSASPGEAPVIKSPAPNAVTAPPTALKFLSSALPFFVSSADCIFSPRRFNEPSLSLSLSSSDALASSLAATSAIFERSFPPEASVASELSVSLIFPAAPLSISPFAVSSDLSVPPLASRVWFLTILYMPLYASFPTFNISPAIAGVADIRHPAITSLKNNFGIESFDSVIPFIVADMSLRPNKTNKRNIPMTIATFFAT